MKLIHDNKNIFAFLYQLSLIHPSGSVQASKWIYYMYKNKMRIFFVIEYKCWT